jgi:DNA repair protein RecO (recombination protein O)
MPPKSAEAILLRTYAVGEADQILVFLTQGEGKLRGRAHGSRKSRKRFGGALQPLSHVRVHYFEREGHDLARIDECDLLHSYFVVQQGLKAAGYLSYVAEVTEEFCREKQSEEQFFRLLMATLAAVEAGADPAWSARYFELWTLRLHGLLPDLSACVRCAGALGSGARYAPRERGLLCKPCSYGESGLQLETGVLQQLRSFIRQPPAAVSGNDDLLVHCENFLQVLLTGFTERPFRSLRVLREMGVR